MRGLTVTRGKRLILTPGIRARSRVRVTQAGAGGVIVGIYSQHHPLLGRLTAPGTNRPTHGTSLMGVWVQLLSRMRELTVTRFGALAA
ncbi:hypothetical protein V6N12_062175 [Hibiscus sabdariffa]|uniref:Uncharacterized protein n=1 Tax=Hibiscus sabdariffa TaxID=183260 RepID=A0ABR2F851_9ROSI